MKEVDYVYSFLEPYVYELILYAYYKTSHVLNLTKNINYRNLDVDRKVYVVNRVNTGIMEHPQVSIAHKISPSIILVGFILGKPSFDIRRKFIYVGIPYRLISKNYDFQSDPLFKLLQHKEKSLELFSRVIKDKIRDTFFSWSKSILGETHASK